jgi:hypothetical protein
MDYFDKYAERLRVQGTSTADSYEDRMIAGMRQDWEKSPSYRKVCVEFPDGTTQPIRIQTAKKTVGMDKIYVHPDDKLVSGAIILNLQEHAWLVLDVRYIGHVFQQANTVRINRTLQWIQDGELLTQQIRAKSYSRVDGIDEFYTFTTPENTINLFLPQSEKTNKIKRDHRFMIDGIPYKISKVDSFTYVGVNVLFAIEDLKHETDTDEIADYEEPTVIPEGEYIIQGPASIKYGDYEEYTLQVDGTVITPSWSVLDSPSWLTLSVIDDIATIEIEFDSAHIGKNIVLQAEHEGITYIKSVMVSSLV